MLVPQKLFLTCDSESDPTALWVENSVQTSLACEKSCQLTDNRAERDIWMHLATSASGKVESKANHQIILAPCYFDGAHGMEAGQKLHGYRSLAGQSVFQCLSDSRTDNSPLPLEQFFDDLPASATALACRLENTFNLRGPWHAEVISGEKIAVYRYACPELTPIHSALGVNWYALLLFDLGGKPVSVLRQALKGRVNRRAQAQTILRVPAKAVYLDLDDTLIIHGKVHDGALKLLEFCAKYSIPVHLITRHASDPAQTLNHFGIASDLFASIIWITNGSPKSNYMTEKEAIFIDDAFKERQEVYAKRGIPSLPPDAAALLQPFCP